MFRRLFALCLFLIALALPAAYAQDITGTLLGAVTDSTGAFVPNAKITVTNDATQAVTAAVSAADGSYSVRLAPGVYKLQVSADGFQRLELTSIRVQVNESTRVDAAMTVGTTSETVSVTSQAVNVDTNSSTLKSVIDQTRIEELPLNGRNALQLMTLTPGVTRDPSANVISGTTFPGVSPVSVNGTRSNSTNYILDGANHNAHYNNAPNPLPNPDALQEFSVQTNNFSAEYGRQAGGVVNAITRSGTNQWHGAVYEFVRDAALNGTNYFSRKTDGLKRHQFGGAIGGPIWIPKVYSGKDRSFFFVSYQHTMLRQTPATSNAVVPTAAQRAGDFSSIGKQLYDKNGNPYTNNQIPTSAFDPVAVKLLQFIPLPAAGSNLLFYKTKNDTNEDDWLVRIDHQLTAKNRITFRYWNAHANQPGLLDPTNYLSANPTQDWVSRSIVGSDTHVFSANLVNEALFSYVTNPYSYIPIYPSQSLVDLGVNFHPNTVPQYELNIADYFRFYTGDLNVFTNDEYQGLDTLRWNKGNHQVSFGGSYNYGRGNQINNHYQSGLFSFASQATPSAPFSGNSLADFLTGHFNSLTQDAGDYKMTRFNDVAGFIMDSWKLSRHLVINAGARYEPFLPFTDARNYLAAWRPGQQSTVYVNAPKGVVFPGDKGIGKGAANISWGNFAPRVGFALDVFGNGRTSLRGGYGLFFDQLNTIYTNNMATQAPFSPTVIVNGNTANSLTNPWAGTTEPFPVSGTPSSTTTFPQLSSQYLYAENFRNEYIHSYNLSAQHQLLQETVLTISYAGSKGSRLPAVRELNAAVYGPGATVANTNARRPLAPALGSTSLLEAASWSNYNALQIAIERRLRGGFSISANYQFSKALDNSSNSKQTGQSVTNPNNLAFDYGRSDFDRRHVFNLSSVWNLPGNFHNRAVHATIGKWSWTNIVNYTGGYPFSIFSGVDNAFSGTSSQRADLTGVSPYVSGERSKQQTIAAFLNAAAFRSNALGTFGNTGRNTFAGPSFTQWDMGLYKTFAFTERYRLMVRMEGFNILNHTNLGNPNTTVSSSQFTKITTAYDPRILQFGAHFSF